MKILLLLFLLLSKETHGGMPPYVTLKGYVIRFDKKNVTITNPMKEVVVPRSSILKGQEVKVGRFVSAKIKSDFILKNIAKRRKKASEQRRKNRYKKK